MMGYMKTLLLLATLIVTLTTHAKTNLEIIKIGHPTLRATAQEVIHAEISNPEFQSLIDDMISTMSEAGGVGLAAPQVNKSLRMFVMKSWPSVSLTVVINPTIEYLEDFGKKDSVEGCLSIPGKNLKVQRFKKIHLSYFDRKGEYISVELNGFGAIIAQHEYLVEQMISKINYIGFSNAPLM